MFVKHTALAALALAIRGTTAHDQPVEYGVDVSFPIHHDRVSDNYAWLEHNRDPSVPVPDKFKDAVVQPLGDRQSFYDDFIKGCVDYWGNKGWRCIETERDRIAMSLRQPQSMQNYTDIGFKKIRAPEKIWRLVRDFWDKNKDKAKTEVWGPGNTYTNNWVAPSKMVSVDDSSLDGGGPLFKQQIWDAARETIQEWTGQELTESSLYGIRMYTEGAVLNPHVDRLPLVSSCIINVDQDVDEPWLLEVYGHDGKAVNVTMLPGDMVLYESHSVLHGRPNPLKGRFMANIFIHFQPTGNPLRRSDSGDSKIQRDVAEMDQPIYILPNSPEEEYRRKKGDSSLRRATVRAPGSTPAHVAAQNGDLEALKKEVDNKRSLVHAKDRNGWTPLHEGARAGHVDVVKFLVEQGANVNEMTGEGQSSGSVLWWAKRHYDVEHPMIRFLVNAGAKNIGPGAEL